MKENAALSRILFHTPPWSSGVVAARTIYNRLFSSAEPASTALRLKALPDLKL